MPRHPTPAQRSARAIQLRVLRRLQSRAGSASYDTLRRDLELSKPTLDYALFELRVAAAIRRLDDGRYVAVVDDLPPLGRP